MDVCDVRDPTRLLEKEAVATSPSSMVRGVSSQQREKEFRAEYQQHEQHQRSVSRHHALARVAALKDSERELQSGVGTGIGSTRLGVELAGKDTDRKGKQVDERSLA